jgi:competence ComEA-like helix-hairpin-helix protein
MRRPLRSSAFPLLLALTCLLALAGASATKKPPIHPVNLNSATSEELQQVPGIGPSTAGKILQMRKSYGAFKAVDDLMAIRGIGKKRLEKMRKYLVAGRSVPPPRIPPTGKSAQNPINPAHCSGCGKSSSPSAPDTTAKPVATARSSMKSAPPSVPPVPSAQPDEDPQ